MLDFSDATFSTFFSTELDVDIDDPAYKTLGNSKGKRLRRFLEVVDDDSVIKTLRKLWERRSQLLKNGRRQTDTVLNAEGRLLSLIAKLEGQTDQSSGQPPIAANNLVKISSFRDDLLGLDKQPRQARGYAFEKFLKQLFEFSGLTPRDPFRNVGEQIDGSFSLGNEIYLLEAKWQNERTGAADLHVLEGKLAQKAVWARGLFVSYTGYSSEGLMAFGTGKRLICMEGKEIYDALGKHVPIKEVLDRKVRAAAETGKVFVPAKALFGWS
ncbi:restriction endonuclease [Rhizobium rhizogenes]|uniref:Endonuclease n=1 Tax=Rhizobium rhizogenes NBRC 13257 TaxID=1220581 RepID=A0AA87Q5S3_RHIRH|nr:restriction endonuclease [Rhizobium rhizogenes]GAJ96061.1 putative endonuclease [Rhizobium rhizogenes NBRC 13257]